VDNCLDGSRLFVRLKTKVVLCQWISLAKLISPHPQRRSISTMEKQINERFIVFAASKGGGS
jgi:hypothetical protein